MDRYLRNTAAVMFASALTAMAVYGVVLLLNPSPTGYTQTASSGIVAANYDTSGGSSLTCPATGCTASSCHATSGGGGRGSQGSTTYQTMPPAHGGYAYDD